MKIGLFLVTATGALLLASSGLGAGRAVNRQMFDGLYSIRMVERARVCTDPGAPPPDGAKFTLHTVNLTLPLRVRDGKLASFAGTAASRSIPINFSGLSLIKGELKLQHGSASDLSTYIIWFIPGYMGNPKGVSVSLKYTHTGHFVSEGCGGYDSGGGLGHRVGA